MSDRGDPLAGIRAMVFVAAVNVAEAACSWEASGGDPTDALRMRLAASEYRKMRDSLAEMTQQLAALENAP